MSQFIAVFDSSQMKLPAETDGAMELAVPVMKLTAPAASDATVELALMLTALRPNEKVTIGVDIAGRHQVTVHSPALRVVKNDPDAYRLVRPDGTVVWADDHADARRLHDLEA